MVATDRRWGVNSTAIATANSFLIIDTMGSPATFRVALAAFIKHFDSQPCAAINTHHHYDHVLGNQELASLPIYAHSNLPQWMESYSQRLLQQVAEDKDFKDFSLTIPAHTIDETTRLTLDSLAIELIVPGPCHTDNDIVVHIPALDLIVTGDIHVPDTVVPLNPNSGGDIRNWARTLEYLAELQPACVVPGHFSRAGTTSLLQQKGYLDQLVSVVGALRDTTESEFLLKAGDQLQPFAAMKHFSRYFERNLLAARNMLSRNDEG